MNTTLYKAEKRLKSLETRLKPHTEIVLYTIINRQGYGVFSAELPMYINNQRIF